MKVSVVGLGRLGSPLLAVLAFKGFDVIGVDQNPANVAAVRDGHAPVTEPGLQELFDQARSRIHATGNTREAVAASDVTFVVVPTPSMADASFSNSYVIAAIGEIGAALRGANSYHLVVITSTVMPGSTGGPLRNTLERAAGRRVGEGLGLCYNPEFVALGSVVHDMLHPDLILIGESDAYAGDVLTAVHSAVCENQPPIRRMNLINAEIAKIAVNSFVTTKIPFANMISGICERLPDADATTVAATIGCDSRIGSKYLTPALGYGGPCFPRDNAAFAAMAYRVGASAEVAEAADAINRQQVGRIVSLVRSLMPEGRVGILGLSYKPNTVVVEASQGIAIAAALADAGYAVIASDPQAADAAASVLGTKVEVAASVEVCAAKCDLLVIATPWPEFRNLPPSALQRPGRRLIVIDCWRTMPVALGETVQLVYLGQGASGEAVSEREGSRPDAALKFATKSATTRGVD